MKAFVEKGGQLLTTYFTGYVDENQLCYLGGFPGDGLSELFGVISEEIDTLYQGDENAVIFEDGSVGIVKDYAEILRVTDAKVLAAYRDDFYAGTPAVTVKTTGKGHAWYVGARIDMDKMHSIFADMAKQAGITLTDIPEGVEYHTRSMDDACYEFYINCSGREQKLSNVNGINLLNDVKVDGVLQLEVDEVAVIKKQV